jgi:CRP-like cAMP-binding protein
METIKPQLAQKLLTMYARRCEEQQQFAAEKAVTAGDFLIHQGDMPQQLYLLLQGTVKIYHTTLKGNEVLMAIVGPGEILGEAEILTQEAHICSIKTLWESKVAVISKKEYLDWLGDDKDFSLAINQVLCYRLQNCSARAATHLSYPLEYSTLKLFLQLSEETQTSQLEISKTQIADYLGTSLRSVNRILKKYQEQEKISIERNKIYLPRPSVLEKMMADFEV